MNTPGVIRLCVAAIFCTCILASAGMAEPVADVPSMELIGGYGGACLSIDVQGDYAYVGQGMNLVIYDISAYRPPYGPDYVPPAEPLRLGSVFVNGRADEVIAHGTNVFVAAGEAGLKVVDVADPGHPQVGSTLTVAGEVTDVALQGDFLYLTWSTSDLSEGGVKVFDASSASGLTLAGEYSFPGARAIAATSKKVYVGGGTGVGDPSYEIVALDITVPASPSLVGSMGMPLPADDLEVSEEQNALFVTQSLTDMIFVLSAGESLDFLNFIPVGRYACVRSVDGGVLAINSYEYQSIDSSNLALLYVSHPGFVQELSRVHFADRPSSLDVDDGFVVCGSETGRLQIVNLASQYELATVLDPPSKGQADQVVLEGNRAYLTYVGEHSHPAPDANPNRFAGTTEIVDISLPSDPRLLGTFHTLSEIASVYDSTYVAGFYGNNACVAWGTADVYGAFFTSGALETVDLTDPLHPHGGTVNLGGFPIGIAVEGAKVYLVTSGQYGQLALQVFDISSFESPSKLGERNISGFDYYGNSAIVAKNGLVYVAHGDQYSTVPAITVFDCRIPTIPRILATYGGSDLGTSWNRITGFSIKKDLAYLTVQRSDWFSGIDVLDVSHPTGVTLLGSLTTETTQHHFVDGDVGYGEVYIADPNCGIMRCDASDPTSPSFIDAGDTNGYYPITSVAARDGLVYSLSEMDGLTVLNEHRFPLITMAEEHGTIDPAPFEQMVNEGSEVTLTAVPDPQYEFLRWVGDVAGDPAANPLTFTMDSKKTVTATFQELRYDLEILAEGHGYTDPVPGAHRIIPGTAVSVSAIPQDGWRFGHWEGDYSGEAETSPTTITMTGDKSLKAVFVPVLFTLTMGIAGSGTTSPEIGSQTYPTGTEVNAVAIPADGWRFVRWEGDVAGDPASTPMAFTLNGDTSLTAVFEPIPRTLTLAIEGNGSTNPAPGQYTHPDGAAVTLTATPNPGWEFDRWESGGLKDSSDNPVTITMNEDKTITAVFIEESSSFGCAGDVPGADPTDVAVLGFGALALWLWSQLRKTPRKEG